MKGMSARGVLWKGSRRQIIRSQGSQRIRGKKVVEITLQKGKTARTGKSGRERGRRVHKNAPKTVNCTPKTQRPQFRQKREGFLRHRKTIDRGERSDLQSIPVALDVRGGGTEEKKAVWKSRIIDEQRDVEWGKNVFVKFKEKSAAYKTLGEKPGNRRGKWGERRGQFENFVKNHLGEVLGQGVTRGKNVFQLRPWRSCDAWNERKKEKGLAED